MNSVSPPDLPFNPDKHGRVKWASRGPRGRPARGSSPAHRPAPGLRGWPSSHARGSGRPPGRGASRTHLSAQPAAPWRREHRPVPWGRSRGGRLSGGAWGPRAPEAPSEAGKAEGSHPPTPSPGPGRTGSSRTAPLPVPAARTPARGGAAAGRAPTPGGGRASGRLPALKGGWVRLVPRRAFLQQ